LTSEIAPSPTPGLTGEVTVLVTPQHTASALTSGHVEAFGTPAMLALVEHAAYTSVQPALPAHMTTVGSEVRLRHLAPTPVGMHVTARSRLTEMSGRRLVFLVEVFDELEKVGEATHERFIVDSGRFHARVQEKRRRATGAQS
jgi:predicted thioesterase